MERRREQILDPDILKAARNAVLDAARSAGCRRKVFLALERASVAPRGDVIIVESMAGMTDVRALSMIAYRESTGEVPRVAVEPLIDFARDGQILFGDAVNEVVGRVSELRAVAAATGAPRIEIAVAGPSDRADTVRKALCDILDPLGLPVLLDGRPIPYSPVPGGVARNPFDPELASQMPGEAWRGYGDRNAGRDPAEAGGVGLAADDAWASFIIGPAEASRKAPVPVPESFLAAQGSDRICGYLQEPQSGRQAFEFHRQFNIVGGRIRRFVDNVGLGHGASAAFVFDPTGAPFALLTMDRRFVLDQGPGGRRIGYWLRPMIVASHTDRSGEACRIAKAALMCQTTCDLSALAGTIPGTAPPIVDVTVDMQFGGADEWSSVQHAVAVGIDQMKRRTAATSGTFHMIQGSAVHAT